MRPLSSSAAQIVALALSGQCVGLTGDQPQALSQLLREVEDAVAPEHKVLRFSAPVEPGSLSVRRAVSPELSRLAEIEREARQVQEARADPTADMPLLEREYQTLTEEYDRLGGRELRRQVHEVLYGLGFRSEDLRRPLDQLRDAERYRIALAQVLLTPCDVLLLDRPTRWLEPAAARWLALLITHAEMAVIIASESRTFLGQVSNQLLTMTGGILGGPSPSKRLPIPVEPDPPARSSLAAPGPDPSTLDPGALRLRIQEMEQRFERVRDILARPDTYQAKDSDKQVAALTEQFQQVEEQLMALYEVLAQRERD